MMPPPVGTAAQPVPNRSGIRALVAVALGVSIVALGCSTPQAPAIPDPTASIPPVSTAPPASPDPNAIPDPTLASVPDATDPNAPDPNAKPQATPKKVGPDGGDRARAALEGALMGALIGSQAGPIGMAVVAASSLVYGAVVGDVPFGGMRRDESYPTETERENEIDEELDRQASLEDEIQKELERQEELLEQIDRQEGASVAPAPEATAAPDAAALSTKANPRIAPTEPKLRELPTSVFDEKHTSMPTPDGKGKQAVVAHTLDADRDGKPEEVRYFDEKTAQLVRVDEDRDYDGRIDAWNTYAAGVLATRQLDESGDGKVDAWETYAGGRMTSREVDRDGNGTRDAFYVYTSGALVEERHDTKGNGKIDRVVKYQGGHIAVVEEDRDADGQLDAWSRYAVEPGGNEVVVKVERDTKGDGKADTFEDFAQQDGKTVLTRREEDVNQDGTPDIVSIYDKGKLVKREISDPALTPL